MSVDVVETAVIERPIGEVSAFAGDPSNAPTWYRRVSSAEWETDPPITLGSRIAFRARFMGRDLAYVYEVTEYTPGEQVAMRWDPNPYCPIHDRDIFEQTEALLNAASPSCPVANWGGDDAVPAQEWCRLFGEIPRDRAAARRRSGSGMPFSAV